MAELLTPVKVAADIASELVGLSSLERLGEKYAPKSSMYTRRKFRTAKGKILKKLKFRGQGIPERMAPSAKQSTRQFGEVRAGPAETIQQRTLKVDAIAFPPQGGNVGNRLGTTIRTTGISLCERFINRGQNPVTLHYCLLQPKAPIQDVDNFDFNTDFFRSTIADVSGADNTKRTVDFNNVSEVDNTYQFYYDCWGVNPDKFNVLMHKKILLSPRDILQDTAGNDTSQIRPRLVKDYIWEWNQYIPMKDKRLTFNDKEDTVPNQPLIRVYWHQALDSDEFNPTVPIPGANPAIKNLLHRYHNSTVYFKNGLN